MFDRTLMTLMGLISTDFYLGLNVDDADWMDF